MKSDGEYSTCFKQGFVEGDADEILEVIDHRIYLQHSRYTDMTGDYLSFRSALTNKELYGYSSSGLLRKLIIPSGGYGGTVVAEWIKNNMGMKELYIINNR